ncbi:MAG: toprim domain-containing protein [Candidatus Tectomicrobia bacterium]|nr:toprim domain-containing protein [Candidatus Tectomicrobia bacterium]
MTEYTAEDWAQACDLKKQGREWVGPCPLCGGKDRFHVRDTNATVLVGCRGCIDGRDPSTRRQRYAEVVQAVFGISQISTTTDHWFDQSHSRNPGNARRHTSDSSPSGSIDPATLWRSCMAVANTPAHVYLTKRFVWPPTASGFLPPPDTVRWLHRSAAPRALGLPSGAAGAVTFRYDTGDRQAVAISLEALTVSGERLSDRWRRTHGTKKEARFVVAGQRTRLIVCEGEVSALACHWLYPGATVWALGGTAGLSAFVPPLSWYSIVVETDGDPAGNDAAAALVKRGGVRAVANPAGMDSADVWKAAFLERVAIREQNGQTPVEAEKDTWREAVRMRETP